MSFEEIVKKLSPTLKRITCKLNGQHCFFDEEDLYQEALIHLWNNFKQGRLNHKTDSYILQGCFFHLKNYLRKVRLKAALVNLDDLADNQKEPQALSEDLDTPMVIEAILNNGLSKREKEIFSFSLEGLTVREIGSRLGISHVRVVKLKKILSHKLRNYFIGNN